MVLTNLESLNAVFIRQELPQSERLIKLNQIAITPSKEGVLALIRKVGTIIRKYVSAPMEILATKI